jgi:hypothetical protein
LPHLAMAGSTEPEGAAAAAAPPPLPTIKPAGPPAAHCACRHAHLRALMLRWASMGHPRGGCA